MDLRTRLPFNYYEYPLAFHRWNLDNADPCFFRNPARNHHHRNSLGGQHFKMASLALTRLEKSGVKEFRVQSSALSEQLTVNQQSVGSVSQKPMSGIKPHLLFPQRFALCQHPYPVETYLLAIPNLLLKTFFNYFKLFDC